MFVRIAKGVQLVKEIQLLALVAKLGHIYMIVNVLVSVPSGHIYQRIEYAWNVTQGV